jgi:hypothetical protein
MVATASFIAGQLAREQGVLATTNNLFEVVADHCWLLLGFLAVVRWSWRAVVSRRWGPVLDAKGKIAADRIYRRYADEPGGRDLRTEDSAESPGGESPA